MSDNAWCCRNCKHWRNMNVQARPDEGRCLRIFDAQDDEHKHDAIVEQPAWINSPGGYTWLQTRGGFCCSLHREVES